MTKIKHVNAKGARRLEGICGVLEVSPSRYHRQRTAQDKPYRSRVSDDALLAQIKAIHTQVKGEYGWPRMWKELLTHGVARGQVYVKSVRRTVHDRPSYRGWRKLEVVRPPGKAVIRIPLAGPISYK